jgi:hypothetical protein
MATVDRFFKQGQKDFFRTSKTNGRVHERTNPYNENSFRGKEWLRGFNNSYFKNLRRHK